MRVLIVKNITHEGPGLIKDILNEQNIQFSIIDLSDQVKFPQIEKYNLIVILGGPDSANDKSEKITKQLKFIQLALKREIPIFGICLGMQLLLI